MGSSLSAISDDEDTYIALCKKYGENPDEHELYSIHYDWIRDKHFGRTKLPYLKYFKKETTKLLKRKISNLKQDKIGIDKQIKNLLKELASL